MKLFFAGCARDCDGVLASNIASLLAICDSPWCLEGRIYIAENNSKDNTRKVIERLADQDPRVVPVFFDDLDEVIPVREARIAFCRDRLLDEIFRSELAGLYIPIDLDSDIASSLEAQAFFSACHLVASGECTAVFPSSTPYYYDIHALRQALWCPSSCWKQVHDSRPRGGLAYLLSCMRYVYSRQKYYASLQPQGLISVESAFGGLGIYSVEKVLLSTARYSHADLGNHSLSVCEHVVFNAYFDKLFINPSWLVMAPLEHIQFSLLPFYLKVWRLLRAALSDAKHLALDFLG